MKLRLAAVAVSLLIPALVLGRWQSSGMTEAAEIARPSLPDRIGPWTLAVETTLDDNNLTILQPDAHVLRRYDAADRPPIWAYVGVYAGRAAYGKGAHDPEVCYPAQGWEIVGSQPAAVPLANGETLRVQLLDAHHGNSRQAVAYWFQPAGRWPASSALEQLWRIVDAVAGRPQYAFVRLSTPVYGRGRGPEDLSEFASQIALPIRTALEGGALGDPRRRGERSAGTPAG